MHVSKGIPDEEENNPWRLYDVGCCRNCLTNYWTEFQECELSLQFEREICLCERDPNQLKNETVSPISIWSALSELLGINTALEDQGKTQFKTLNLQISFLYYHNNLDSRSFYKLFPQSFQTRFLFFTQLSFKILCNTCKHIHAVTGVFMKIPCLEGVLRASVFGREAHIHKEMFILHKKVWTGSMLW